VKEPLGCSVGRSFAAALKHSHPKRFFTYWVASCGVERPPSRVNPPPRGGGKLVQNDCRWGVWLGRYTCETIAQVTQGWLRVDGNDSWTKRGKASLILHFSVIANRETVAYRSFVCVEFSPRGARKVTTGITGLWRLSVHSDVSSWSFDVGSSHHCVAVGAKC